MADAGDSKSHKDPFKIINLPQNVTTKRNTEQMNTTPWPGRSQSQLGSSNQGVCDLVFEIFHELYGPLFRDFKDLLRRVFQIREHFSSVDFLSDISRALL